MNSVLEDLYYGEIRPNENGGLAGKANLRNADSIISNCEEKLTELLDGKEKKLFWNFVMPIRKLRPLLPMKNLSTVLRSVQK